MLPLPSDMLQLTAVLLFGLAWFGGVSLLNAAAHKLPCPRLIHWIYAMTFETLALLSVLLMRFFPISKKVKGNGRPILLIHGYLNHGSVWRFPKRRLEGLGFGPIYTINLGHPFRPIRIYAEKVAVQAEKIAKETGRKDLILIGHSMGGLVGGYYATHLAPPHTVTDVMTLGTPLFGTPLARIALGPNGREMEPRSLFLRALREAMAAHRSQIRFYHIATQSDQLVIPGESAVIPEHPHRIFEDIGHASLLYSKRVIHQISQWLL